jgi:lipoate-protein ligase A
VHAVESCTGEKRLGERTPLCFAGVESCDILIGGRKIGGNAQRRLKHVIFQHGSIPLRQMAAEANQYLLQPDHGIASRTTSLEDLGVIAPRQQLAELLSSSFAESFRIEFVPDVLTAAEQETAGEYMQKLE